MDMLMLCSGGAAVQVADIHTEMVDRYRRARQQYREPRIAEACTLVGLSEREYCERYVAQMGSIYMTCISANPMAVRDAFAEAGTLIAQESGDG